MVLAFWVCVLSFFSFFLSFIIIIIIIFFWYPPNQRRPFILENKENDSFKEMEGLICLKPPSYLVPGVVEGFLVRGRECRRAIKMFRLVPSLPGARPLLCLGMKLGMKLALMF